MPKNLPKAVLAFFSWQPMQPMVLTEIERREPMIRAAKLALLAMVFGVVVCSVAPAHAFLDTVPPFKGNDTGGIIAYSLYVDGVDIKALAINHCAHYGKVVKLTGVQAHYGSYISFACIWVHPGYGDKPLRAAY